jgi:hypothetical protein
MDSFQRGLFSDSFRVFLDLPELAVMSPRKEVIKLMSSEKVKKMHRSRIEERQTLPDLPTSFRCSGLVPDLSPNPYFC